MYGERQVGSIPFALIVGKLFYKTDVRKFGSNNLGSANVNVDYEVTVEDAVKFMKHLAGMDVKLGEAE